MSERGKVVEFQVLGEICTQLRVEGQRIVLCHGVFDLLHIGHIKHFKAARKLGDILIVTLTADRFVSKGPGRPAFSGALRAEAISALSVVDYVAIVDSGDAIPSIKVVQPFRYVKGADYRDRVPVAGSRFQEEVERVRYFGGDIAFTEEEQFSSSGLINQFLSPFSAGVRKTLAECRMCISPHEVEQLFRALGELHGSLDVPAPYEGLFKKLFPRIAVVSYAAAYGRSLERVSDSLLIKAFSGVAHITISSADDASSLFAEMYPLSSDVIAEELISPIAYLLGRVGVRNPHLAALFLMVFGQESDKVTSLASLRKVLESILR